MKSDDIEELDFHLRLLSSCSMEAGFSIDLDNNLSILDSVKKLHQACKSEKSDEVIARVYPTVNKIFQRTVASIPQSRSSHGLLLLAILQFFLDFGEVVLHDADRSLRAFLRSCLSREFADPEIVEETLSFLKMNKHKFLNYYPSLLPQFFPLMLKLIAWHGNKLKESFLTIFPLCISPGSFLPIFTSLVDLPILVVALEKVERSSGTLIGRGTASVRECSASEVLLAFMDEAYTGSAGAGGVADSDSEDGNGIDRKDTLFLDLLKDENDGIAECQWASPEIMEVLQTSVNTLQSDRLKEVLIFAPQHLDTYFETALCDINDSLICALLPLLMSRNSTLFPDKVFSNEVRKRLLEFMLAAFQRYPRFILLLMKPIMDWIGGACESPSKMELALHLCWAVGEHGGGGPSHQETAMQLFECLELLLYENLSSRAEQGTNRDFENGVLCRSTMSRLLCFVLAAITKLGTRHSDLRPRARMSLAKVMRSPIPDARVRRRAGDYLGLMNDPAVCLSIMGPTPPPLYGPLCWRAAHLPFYLLGGQQGPPFHDFSFSDIFPRQHNY